MCFYLVALSLVLVLSIREKQDEKYDNKYDQRQAAEHALRWPELERSR
jgi:hypothetical protein